MEWHPDVLSDVLLPLIVRLNAIIWENARLDNSRKGVCAGNAPAVLRALNEQVLVCIDEP